LTF
jgi:hypothetical protein